MTARPAVPAALPSAPPDPAPVLGLLAGVTSYWVLAAAIGVGLLEALHDGAVETAALAVRCDAPADRVAILCAALADLGLVERDGDAWAPSPVAEAFLVPGAPRRLDRLVLHGPGRPENLHALAATVRGGAPPTPVDDDGTFWADLFSATFSTQRLLARATAADPGLGLTPRGPGLVLEVGPAAGAWSVGLLEAFGAAEAVVETSAEVAAPLRAAAAAAGVERRLTVAGADPAVAGFDVAVLANVLRTVGPAGAAGLVAATARRLASGGSLIVADYLVDAPGRAGVMARQMAATMLANTRAGCVHAETDHRSWLAAAGVVDIRRGEPLPGFPVLTGRAGAAGVEAPS